MLTETTLHINDHEFLEPDFIFWPRSIQVKDITAEDVQLLVEVADSSLSYDLGRKARMYAALGVRDYWAIDSVRMLVHIHRFDASSNVTYAQPLVRRHTDLAMPAALPALAVTLADLGLEPLIDM